MEKRMLNQVGFTCQYTLMILQRYGIRPDCDLAEIRVRAGVIRRVGLLPACILLLDDEILCHWHTWNDSIEYKIDQESLVNIR
jgi:hypothetical protein